LLELDDKQQKLEYFETMMRYVFSIARNLTSEDVDKVVRNIENTYAEGSEFAVDFSGYFARRRKKRR